MLCRRDSFQLCVSVPFWDPLNDGRDGHDGQCSGPGQAGQHRRRGHGPEEVEGAPLVCAVPGLQVKVR